MSKRWQLGVFAVAGVVGVVAVAAVSEARSARRPDPGPASVTVELASVTLADDCLPPRPPAITPPPSSGFAQPPPAAPAAARRKRPSDEAAAVPADCPESGCGRARCEQTSMQLVLRAPVGLRPSTIRIQQVELLDAKGRPLQTLAAHAGQRWTGGRYEAWDERISGGDTINAMYALAAPAWHKIAGGRYGAHNQTFQLRVTVAIGNATKSVLRTSIAPAMLPPPVPT